jgi:hypothetical protein
MCQPQTVGCHCGDPGCDCTTKRPSDGGAGTGTGPDAGDAGGTCGTSSCGCVAGRYRTADGYEADVSQTGCTVSSSQGLSTTLGSLIMNGTVQGQSLSHTGDCDFSRTSDQVCCDVTFTTTGLSGSCQAHGYACNAQNPCPAQSGTCNGSTCLQNTQLSAQKLTTCGGDKDCASLQSCQQGYCEPCTVACSGTCPATDVPRQCVSYGNGCAHCQ